MKSIIPVMAACIVKRNPTRVLLHRKDEPRNPELLGLWEFPGGMMEYGETPEQALVREIKEELNIPVEVDRLLHAQTNIYTDRRHYLVLFYICHISVSSEATLNMLKYGCMWCAPGDIRGPHCLPGTQEVARLLV